jgi:hypothetical protein
MSEERTREGKWPGTGADPDEDAALFHVRDRKVTRFVAFWDRERALADRGLSE